MAIFNSPQTKRQLRHTAGRSKSHADDKARGDARRQITWLGVKTPARPSPKRSFSGLQGAEWIHHGDGKWTRCENPEEYADYVEDQARARAVYYDLTQRKGVPVRMKRKTKSPVQIATVNHAPWVSDWTADALAAGRDPRPLLGKVHELWIKTIAPVLNGERFILGLATHTDTSNLHLDLLLSRQTTDGKRIGKAGLRLVGPWCVGVDRQLRAGATIRPDAPDRRELMARFRGLRTQRTR